jgi:hypothetical protein
MTNSGESMITFSADGVFGAGRLATILKGLADSGQIGSWHVGHWVDFRHTAIRIHFDTRAGGEIAKGFIENWHKAHVTAGGRYV